MYDYDITTTWPKWWGPFSFASKLLLFICKFSAVFIFPSLLGDPIQNRDRGSLHIAHDPSIHIL